MKNKKGVSSNKRNQVFLEHKKKERWTDEKTGLLCFMLYPRSLWITWGSSDEYWKWNYFKETSCENIEVAKLQCVCWLDVRGKFKISDLSPGVVYEIAYVVKLKKSAAGWEFPVTLRLLYPHGDEVKVQDRQISLLEKPREEWFELIVGRFLVEDGETNKEVVFDLFEHGGFWKSGLIIMGAVLRPKV